MLQKLTFLLFYLICLNLNLSGQDSVTINDRFTNNAQFLFDDYANAYIHLKNGELTNTDINYNIFFQEIWYKNDNQYFVLKDLDKVEFIELDNFSLLILNNKFYEVVAYSNKYKILKHREINLESLNKNNGAYGTSTVTGSTETRSSYVTRPTSGINKVNDVDNNLDLEFEVITRYFISDDNNEIYSLTKRKLYRLFENKKDSIKEYLKENKINLKNENDIIELFKYIVTL